MLDVDPVGEDCVDQSDQGVLLSGVTSKSVVAPTKRKNGVCVACGCYLHSGAKGEKCSKCHSRSFSHTVK